MEHPIDFCRSLDEDALLAQAAALAGGERELLYQLIARLAVIDEKKLFRSKGCSSMFDYCLRVLGFSEAVTFGRIRVARLARRVPVVLDHIRDGTLPLSHLEKVAAHMTPENAGAMVGRIQHLPTREVERLAASLSPRPDLPDSARAQAWPTRAGSPASSDPVEPGSAQPDGSQRDRIRWLSASRILFRFSGGPALHEKLLTAAAVVRRARGRVSFAAVLEAALDCFLERARPEPAPAGLRRIPHWVRRAVWRRDRGQCAWVEGGCRCACRSGLEFDHIRPWSEGGSSDDPDNLRLLCPPHHRARHRNSG